MSAEPGPVTVSWPLLVESLDRDATAARIPILLAWSSNDPLVVVCEFPEERVSWIIGRDLLAAGLDAPAGLGDVAVLPDLLDPERLELILSSPYGRVGLLLPRTELAAFLRATREPPEPPELVGEARSPEGDLADWEW